MPPKQECLDAWTVGAFAFVETILSECGGSEQSGGSGSETVLVPSASIVPRGTLLICPMCSGEVNSLHSEWRGYRFAQRGCPKCLNDIVVTKEKSIPRRGTL